MLIVDLASGGFDGVALVERLRAEGELEGHAHARACTRTSTSTRKRRAEAAGFDLVVPRSRMAREGPALVERLAGIAVAGAGERLGGGIGAVTAWLGGGGGTWSCFGRAQVRFPQER